MDSFSNIIYNWYNKNKRDLPWRSTKDAYKIWLSEIILQQTRVAQGTAYYLRFVEKFPTIEHLARAKEDEVLKLWQGLGYYSRARNLHATAKIIVNQYGGTFPNTHKQILALKGIGPYTAAAIASFAFGLSYPTVDGNVYRVLARYFGISTPIDSSTGKKEFQQLAEELIINKEPGLHNQSLMEFGALQCTPKSPKCHECPLKETCFALENKLVNTLPIKEKKIKQHKRYFYYYLLKDKDCIYIQKRTAKDIWQNLYEFPLFESKLELTDEQLLKEPVPFFDKTSFIINGISAPQKHILSHQIIHARLIYVELKVHNHIPYTLIRVNKKDISKFAVPRLIEQFLSTFNWAE